MWRVGLAVVLVVGLASCPPPRIELPVWIEPLCSRTYPRHLYPKCRLTAEATK